VTVEKKWGQKGGPWEFNLRDLFRWCQLILVDQSPGCYDPGQHVFLVYGERMRTREDKEKVSLLLVHLSLCKKQLPLNVSQIVSQKPPILLKIQKLLERMKHCFIPAEF
jgi:midasin (ATPase involved in ribosome maturation)